MRLDKISPLPFGDSDFDLVIIVISLFTFFHRTISCDWLLTSGAIWNVYLRYTYTWIVRMFFQAEKNLVRWNSYYTLCIPLASGVVPCCGELYLTHPCSRRNITFCSRHRLCQYHKPFVCADSGYRNVDTTDRKFYTQASRHGRFFRVSRFLHAKNSGACFASVWSRFRLSNLDRHIHVRFGCVSSILYILHAQRKLNSLPKFYASFPTLMASATYGPTFITWCRTTYRTYTRSPECKNRNLYRIWCSSRNRGVKIRFLWCSGNTQFSAEIPASSSSTS